MKPFEVLALIGPEKSIKLHTLVFSEFNQPFRCTDLRKNGDKYDIDITLKNGEKRTVSV